ILFYSYYFYVFVFFFTHSPTPLIYTLSLHDALPISVSLFLFGGVLLLSRMVDHGTARWKNGVELEIFLCSKSTAEPDAAKPACRDRKSTRLNSSHVKISYAVFCLKKKKTKKNK